MDLLVEISRVDPKLADELLRLLNELELARAEKGAVRNHIEVEFFKSEKFTKS